ncbi:MAG TPA: NADH-quinone oxidoreductase subunit N, partial [Dehalococcoidia bacterium]|nr:NADH-quinone oxidoreductase subunit N [Dehalococcoidia bacterium]
FGFKIAAVPFQMWVPDVYEGAPTPITAYLSVASKAAGFAVILRVFNQAFGAPAGISLDWAALFAILAAITMTVGNVLALVQTNIKRLLGYSSIAQAGYLLVGLATLSSLGRSGVIFFLIAYAFTNLGAFFAITAISHRLNSDLIDDYSGMARRSPVLSLALALCLISLTGIPLTGGFWAKVYIFNAAVQYQLVWLVLVAVINTILSAYYYLKVVKAMYFNTPPSEERVTLAAPVQAALFIASAGVLVVGVIPAPFLRLAEAAITTLSP